mmetsp:Transcript_70375/g.139593  ORF Transcript_70375/g.139593 Transcript_70375/m.139593 type:complete len:150 (+) Transcript_70375:61-510(+)
MGLTSLSKAATSAILLTAVVCTAPRPRHSTAGVGFTSLLQDALPEQVDQVGAMGSEWPATPEVQELCNTVKAKALLSLQKKADSNVAGFKQFKAMTYTSQVVSGTNYAVKVDIGDEHKLAILKIYKPLPFMKTGPELTDASLLNVHTSK